MTELVFIHGWGFNASFWDPLAEQLKDFPQRRVDLGFYGTPSVDAPSTGPQILIGHSLGFMHGIAQRQNWAGWVAINSFARFVPDCVPSFMLRGMRAQFGLAPQKTLGDFYSRIGATHLPTGTPDLVCLRAGLDELHDGKVTEMLAGMDVPGLVLASRKDPLVPARVSEALGATSGKTALAWSETGGHMLPQTESAWCGDAIKGFLTSNITFK